MKKIISILLIVSMLFSLSSTALSAEDKSITTENYAEIINEKVKNENFFIKFIAKLIIIGVKLRLISISQLENWLYLSTPETNNTSNNDWDDGTKLRLFPEQSLPFTKTITYYDNDVTIEDILITKERYNRMHQNIIYNYKYNITISGSTTKTIASTDHLSINIHFQGETHFIPGFPNYYSPDDIVFQNNHFTIKGTFYSNEDSDFYTIYDINIWEAE